MLKVERLESQIILKTLKARKAEGLYLIMISKICYLMVTGKAKPFKSFKERLDIEPGR
jgi:hypothetical protein